MLNSVLTEILRTKKVSTSTGESLDLHSSIDETEGRAIYDLIREHKISRSLEIGCAYGISSLYICDALAPGPERRHTIIDCAQSTNWQGVGISNLRKAGFDFFSLIEKPSEIALPELLAAGEKFQLVFIDGWHTFDHTLLDFFYANRLVEDGGFIAIDDYEFPAIAKAVRYISSYPNYRVCKRANVQSPPSYGLARRTVSQILQFIASVLPAKYSLEVFTEQFRNPVSECSMIIFQKIGPDTRNWDWYRPF